MKGANNRLSNGIVPLQIVCEQVGSLGVRTRQVSTGLSRSRGIYGPGRGWRRSSVPVVTKRQPRDVTVSLLPSTRLSGSGHVPKGDRTRHAGMSHPGLTWVLRGC